MDRKLKRSNSASARVTHRRHEADAPPERPSAPQSAQSAPERSRAAQSALPPSGQERPRALQTGAYDPNFQKWHLA